MKMNAIVYTSYGFPNGLQLRVVEKLTPKDNEVLISVHAASANPLDWHKMRASPFLVRFSEGFLKPKHPVLGTDIAGRVEAVGSKITQFKVGMRFSATSIRAALPSTCAPPRTSLLTSPPRCRLKKRRLRLLRRSPLYKVCVTTDS